MKNVVAVVKRNPFVLALACVAATALIFISEGSYWRSVSRLDTVGAVHEARAAIQSLAQGILDAESGQRGYLLTGRNEYLVPYRRALANIGESFIFLDAYYGKNPQSAGIVDKLHALTETKLSELSETIRVQDEGRTDLAKELVLTDIGKEKMEAIRAIGAQLLSDETNNVASGRAEVYRSLMVSRIGIALLTVLSLLALATYLRQSAVLVKQQLEQQRLVQAERDQLEIIVGQRTQLLTALAQHLQTAREDERQRLARNLHDELGALLTSAKLDAARIKSRLAGGAPEAQERLAHLVETLNSSIALGRSIIEDLRPSTLANLGLVSAIEILVREFGERAGVQVHQAMAPVKLRPSAELMVYRLVQEAITNITKYAKARQVWVSLAAQGGQVQVSVRDDGIGFDPASQPGSAYGLVGMRFRVEAEQGVLTVVSAPGQGTHIQASLPESA